MLNGKEVSEIPERKKRPAPEKPQEFVALFYYSRAVVWEVEWEKHYLNSSSAAGSLKYAVRELCKDIAGIKKIKVINRDNRVYLIHL